MNQPIKNQQGTAPVNSIPQNRTQPMNRSTGIPPATGNRMPANHQTIQYNTPRGNPSVQINNPQRNMRPMQPNAPLQQPRQGQPYQQNGMQAPYSNRGGSQMPQQMHTPIPAKQEQSTEQRPVQNPLPQSVTTQEEVFPHETPVATTPAPAPTPNPYVPNFATDFKLSPAFITTQGVLGIGFTALVLGVIFGSVLFGGSSTPPPTGLQGVIRNADILPKTPRCGRIDRGQACILYIMNSSRDDKVAEDFFDEAVKLTEIQKYSIAMANPKYAKIRIPPGHFAEIKIPDVR